MKRKSQRKMVLDMPRPSAKQMRFFHAREDVIIFGGARGGGKSWAVRWKAVLMALRYPRIKLLIVRRTWPELKKNHINPLKLMLHGLARYNEQEKAFFFESGSLIQFQYVARDDDLLNLQGAEYDVIFVDEATNLTEYQIKQLKACIRGVNDYPKRLYLTCNPGGKGHQYIKRLKEGRLYPEEQGEKYTFIQSLVTDNKALMESDPGYKAKLEALPPKIRKAWLEGDWDIYEGQFFEQFRDDPTGYETRTNTHVIPPFDIPHGWKVYRSYDWGYNHPFSCGWWAMDYDGVIYRILELYGCTQEPNTGVKWTDERQFREIARIEREHPWLKGRKIQGVADPSIWSAEKTGVSTADVAAAQGVYFDKANNDRIAGWRQCQYRLAFDKNGYPMMYVFSNCKAFIRTIPLLCYSETQPEDLDTEEEDHVADEWRYFCMLNPIKPRASEDKKIPFFDPLNMF